MNKIVLEHYPVSKLPQDMREGLAADATVRVVIEEEQQDDRFPGFAAFPKTHGRPMTVEETLENIRKYHLSNPKPVTVEEAVSRIRELRDEWDDE